MNRSVSVLDSRVYLSTLARRCEPSAIVTSNRRTLQNNRQQRFRFDMQQTGKLLSSYRVSLVPNFRSKWLRCFAYSWRRAAGLVTFLVLWLEFIAKAYAVDPTSFLSQYPCEDVSHYYATLKKIEGAALMKELNSVVSGHQSLSYKEVWNALMILDAADVDNPEASPDVVEIYSSRAVSKVLAGKPEGWNREHLWPRSYGLIDGISLSDLHNLRPVDVNVNSSRGNKYYGECAPALRECLRPANSEAAPDTEADREIWAPPMQVRGDIARSVMYMAVRYGFHQHSGTPNLQLSDSPSTESREMGLLSALLKWNEIDPPSRAEKLRNDRICSLYQHNRNPFVDHPEYANLIWKHARVLSNPIVYAPSSNAWINEFHYNNKGKDRHEFVEIVARSSANNTDLELVLYNGANGEMYMSLPLADRRTFSVTNGGSGFLIYTATIPLQNGPGDGIALVSGRDGDSFVVLQFLSYEGIVKAIDGPAKDLKSVDINVRETEGSSDNDSLGLTGKGIERLRWTKFTDGATPGALNLGESLEEP